MEERRYFKTDIKIEKREDGTALVEGHAAVFNSRSENLGGFTEIIHDGAFDDVLGDDVRALFNHDSNLILGRSPNTLTVSVDHRGLVFKYESPDTTYARDLLVSLERGDISQSSFGFNIAAVDGAEWIEDEETGAVTRHIRKVSRLFDVSPVTFPAYAQTDVALRSLDKWKEEHKKSEGTSLVDVKIKLNQIKLKL